MFAALFFHPVGKEKSQYLIQPCRDSSLLSILTRKYLFKKEKKKKELPPRRHREIKISTSFRVGVYIVPLPVVAALPPMEVAPDHFQIENKTNLPTAAAAAPTDEVEEDLLHAWRHLHNRRQPTASPALPVIDQSIGRNLGPRVAPSLSTASRPTADRESGPWKLKKKKEILFNVNRRELSE